MTGPKATGRAAIPLSPASAAALDAILAESEALRQAGEREQALDLLADACRRQAGPEAAALGRAYVTAILAAWEQGPPESVRQLSARLTGFMDAHPVLVLRDHRWIDVALRPTRLPGAPVRVHLWKAVLAQPPIRLPNLLRIMGHAQRLRALDVMLLALPLLLRHLAPRRARGLAEDAPHWCWAGDIHLMQDEGPEAENCYRIALTLDAGCGRALLGLAAIAIDRGELGEAAALAHRAAETLPRRAAETLPRRAAAMLPRRAAETLPHRAAEMLPRRAAAMLADCEEAEAAAAIGRAAGLLEGPPEARAPRTMAVIIFCHATTKLQRNAHLAPPGIGLLEACYRSLRAVVGVPAAVPVTVILDHRPGEVNDAFRDRVAHFCAAEGLALVVNTDHGLRRQWLDAFDRIRADLVMVVEQDHEFVRPGPGMEEMLALFAARPDIGQVRLNRRANIRTGFDLMLSCTARDATSGILRTARFSNTPQFLRRDFYDAMVQPLIVQGTRHDGRNQGAGGVEETINVVMARLETLIGLPATMRLFGLSIRGELGEKARCVHLGV